MFLAATLEEILFTERWQPRTYFFNHYNVLFSSTMSTFENATHTVSRFSQVTLKIRGPIYKISYDNLTIILR